MENFGEYITNEYAVLRQILNNLTLTDLLTARKVCKSWHKCVVHILMNVDRSPHFLFTDNFFEDNESEHWDELRAIPDVLIRFTDQCMEPELDERNQCWSSLLSDNESENAFEDIIRKHDEESGLLPPTALLDFSSFGTIGCVPKHSAFKMSLNCSSKVSTCKFLHGIDHTMKTFEKRYVASFIETGTKSSSALVLPRIPGVHYDVIKFHVIRKKIHFDAFPQLSTQSPVKCLLLLDCHIQNVYTIKTLRLLMDHFQIRDDKCFAIGGGRMKAGKTWPRGERGRVHLLAIAISGENVSANSFMLKPELHRHKDIESQISLFAEKVGPVPDGSSRIAIMAQCIDRISSYSDSPLSAENNEAKTIGKYFPNVPLCGFVARGEFGYCSDFDNEEPTAKRIKVKPSVLVKYQSTSLLILTFKTHSKG